MANREKTCVAAAKTLSDLTGINMNEEHLSCNEQTEDRASVKKYRPTKPAMLDQIPHSQATVFLRRPLMNILGHRLCTFTAVPRLTQPSTLFGMINEYQLSG